ncbi:hypothetical protein LguiA_002852 [Lonicera macranthoides]
MKAPARFIFFGLTKLRNKSSERNFGRKELYVCAYIYNSHLTLFTSKGYTIVNSLLLAYTQGTVK